MAAHYRPGLLVILRRRVGDAADAEDLCQETLAAALAALRKGRIKDGTKVGPFLRGISANLASHYWRRRIGRSLGLPWCQPLAEGPEDAALAAERARVIREVIDMLPRRESDVLRQFYLEERSKAELCRELGLTPEQFDLIKFRALQRLRRLGEGGEEGARDAG